MTQALKQLGRYRTVSGVSTRPKLVTLGGDYSLLLPALRALKEVYDRPLWFCTSTVS
jgi:agmatinase